MSHEAAFAETRSSTRSDRDRNVAKLDRLAERLDSQWRIPGLGIRFGLDAVAGLIPVVGDLASGIVSAYVVIRGMTMGAPASVVRRMTVNVALDIVIGSIPILGSVFDVFFKANKRNIRLLRDSLPD